MQLMHEEVTEGVIRAAIEVHGVLGPGLLESAYEECFCHEMSGRGIAFARQVALSVSYKGVRVECGYRMDVVVDSKVVVEIKSVESLLPIHDAQLLTYLRMSGHRVGLLINFNVVLLKDGIKRRIV